MPRIVNQADYRGAPKPSFCYLCGESLQDGSELNEDHCPPKGMFSINDRINYPIKLQVHARCNHMWHIEDEKLTIFFDVLHGGQKVSKPQLKNKLSITKIENDQGVYQGIFNFPLEPLTFRIIRCCHALLYGSYVGRDTLNSIHYPIPQVDRNNDNRPKKHLPQTYEFANCLCTAQKTNTHDQIIAYNGKFKYVCTWSTLDNGAPICIFSFDIYYLANFAVQVEGFPRSVIGMYKPDDIPTNRSTCSDSLIENIDDEVLYPIL